MHLKRENTHPWFARGRQPRLSLQERREENVTEALRIELAQTMQEATAWSGTQTSAAQDLQQELVFVQSDRVVLRWVGDTQLLTPWTQKQS